MKRIFVFLAFVYTINISGQNSNLDSLAYLKALPDTAKVSALIKLVAKYISKNPMTAEMYAQQALEIAKKTNSYTSLGNALFMMGTVKENNAENIKALEFFRKGMEEFRKSSANKIKVAEGHEYLAQNFFALAEYDSSFANYKSASALYYSVKNYDGIISSVNGMASCYFMKADYERAFKLYYKNAKLSEAIKNDAARAQALNNMGNIYYFQQQYRLALNQYKISLTLVIKTNDKDEQALLFNNIGSMYENLQLSDSALDYHLKALQLREELSNKPGITQSLTNIGVVYLNKKEFENANEYLKKAKNFAIEIQDLNSLAIINLNQGILFGKQNLNSEAIFLLKAAMDLADTIGSKELLKASYEELANAYSEQKNFQQAFLYQKKFGEVKDSLFTVERANSIDLLSAKYDNEKKEKDLLLKESELTKQQSENEKKTTQLYLLIIGATILLVIAGLIYRSNVQKNLANKKLENKNDVIFSQNKKLEEKNNDITASITYAKRIQDALLTSQNYISEAFPNHFVCFHPRDIISGDFYWCLKLDAKRALFMTADCTGHGVPGAFMSLLGISFLNEIILERKIVSPEKILEELRKEIIHALNPDGTTVFKDGMDCTLMLFDQETKELSFSAANNPLWIVKRNEDQKGFSLTEFPVDKYPVGLHEGEFKGFKLNKIKLNDGDRIYTFTDGYADQFGGAKGKKFKYKQLQETFLSISHLPMGEQGKQLLNIFEAWQGELEQVDDVLVVGIRV